METDSKGSGGVTGSSGTHREVTGGLRRIALVLGGPLLLSAFVTVSGAWAAGPYRETCEASRSILGSTTEALDKCHSLPEGRGSPRCDRIAIAVSEARSAYVECSTLLPRATPLASPTPVSHPSISPTQEHPSP